MLDRFSIQLAVLLVTMVAALAPATAGASSPPPGSPFATQVSAAAAGGTPDLATILDRSGLGPSAGTSKYPPDSTGAIGPSDYVQMVNDQIGVYRRSDLGLASGPISNQSFAGLSSGDVVLDPEVTWDPSSRRWYYIASYTVPGSSDGLAYGWSRTSDPTNLQSGWCRLQIKNTPDRADRPKLGTSGRYLVFTSDQFHSSTQHYSTVWTVPKPAAGSTSCPTSQAYRSFGSVAAPLAASNGQQVDSPIVAMSADGTGAGYVIAADDRSSTLHQLMLWHVNDSNGGLVPDGLINVSSYFSSEGSPVHQPAPLQSDFLDPQNARVSWAVVHADPDAHGAAAIWADQTIASAGRSAVRWYELIPGACNAGNGTVCSAATVRQQGNLTDPSSWVFNAAISPTDAGNEAVINYNVAGSGLFPQVRARSRTSSTPLGTFGPEVTLATSVAGAQDSTCTDKTHSPPFCRWGDYAGASPDPSNAHAVWGSNQTEGAPNGSQISWRTENFALAASFRSTLRTGGVKLARVLRNGLRVTYGSDVPGRARFTLQLGRNLARRFHLTPRHAAKAVALAGSSFVISERSSSLVLHVRKRLRSVLQRHAGKRLPLTLTITVTDALGRSHSYSIAVTLRR